MHLFSKISYKSIITNISLLLAESSKILNPLYFKNDDPNL